MTTAILGIRGTGKTNTATVLVEEALEHGQRSVILDPLDVWWGLKSSADGNSPGYDVAVFGGHHQDLPLGKDQGAHLADLLVDHPVTAVLSLRHLRKGEQQRFVADFCERLYHRKGEAGHRDRLLVVIDEASSFVPQSFQGDAARCVGAVEDLVRRGRASGIGVCLIDQRAASVNKNVLTQLEVLISHRQVSPQDRKAVKDWVEASDDGESTKELVRTIASLGQGESKGEAWVWSPYLSVFERTRIRMRRTFDSSRTPGSGEAPAVPSAVAKVDLEQLRQALAQEVETDDPKALQAEIAKLRQQLAEGKPSEGDVAREVAIAIKPIEERNAHLEFVIGELREVMAKVNGILAKEAFIGRAASDERSLEIPQELKFPAASEKRAEKVNAVPVAPSEGISRPQQRMLDALSSFQAIGVGSLSKGNLAVFSDQSPKSSGYRNNLSALSSKSLIRYGGEGVAITPEGLALAVSSNAPASRSELHRAWKAKLSQPQARMLAALIEVYPDGLHRSVLATKTNQSFKSSGYRNNLSKLSGLGLIRYDGPEVRATDLLFPEGLK
jgi:hypothetical protein